MQKNKLNIWLDQKVRSTNSINSTNRLPPEPYCSAYTKDAYYSNLEKDSDLKYLTKKSHPDRNLYQDHIFIDPNTNRYHANMLFRMMVDYSYDKGFDYVLHDPETKKKYVEFNLMDKELKESFYKFCYENT